MSVGQPTPLTHPHLMGVGELTPGFSAREYAERRGRLAEKLPPHSVALLAAASPAHLPNTVIPYPAYRQDADFAYLTGVLQPGCVAMVARGSDAADCAFALFVPPRSERQETWNGARLCANAAIEYFGADEAFERGPGTTREILKRLAGADAIFADEDAARDRFVAAALGTAGVASSRLGAEKTRIKPLRPLVHALRWRKSRAEIHAMRLSVEADIAGFHAAMRVSAPGVAERDAAAEHERAVKLFGADRLAYPSVVGSGAGALVIHYAAMDALMRDGDVLLMDAGCERAGYVSDVTRTLSVRTVAGSPLLWRMRSSSSPAASSYMVSSPRWNFVLLTRDGRSRRNIPSIDQPDKNLEMNFPDLTFRSRYAPQRRGPLGRDPRVSRYAP